MVETLKQHLVRYVIQVPADHPEYALDTVVCEEGLEFDTSYVGEVIIAHRVMCAEEINALIIDSNLDKKITTI